MSGVYRQPPPSDIWGADMSRGTFRRFVEANAREQRTLNHIKLARERRGREREEGRADLPGSGSGAGRALAGDQDGSSGIPQSALDEFRVLREFPTLLKIASTHSSVFRSPDKRAAAKHTVVDTSQFASTSRGTALRRSRPRDARNKRTAAPVVCIDAISAIPNTNDSGARVAVRYGNVVRIRSQRSYLQGGVPAQSSILLDTSKTGSSSSSQPWGTVTSAPRVVRDIGRNVPSAVAAAAAAAESMADSDVEEGMIWQIEPMTQFPPGIPSSMSASGSSFHLGASDRTPTRLANDLSNDSVQFGQAFRLVLVVPPETVENSDSEAEARGGQTPTNTRARPRYVLCATLDATSLLSRPASNASGSSSRPLSRAASRKDSKDRKKNKSKTKNKKGKPSSDPGAVRTAQVFLCAEDDPRCTVESCAWCFSGGASGKVVLAERQVRLQSLLWATGRNGHSQTMENVKMPGSEALLHCSNSGTGHVSLIIDDRDTGVASGGVPTPRSAVFNWFVEPLDDRELVAKGLPMFVPASHLAAAQSGQLQGKKKARQRTFRGRSPSKPLRSPPPSYSEEADALMQKQSSVGRPLVSSPTPSPRSRRIAKAAAASAGFRSRVQGRTFGSSSSSSHSTAVMDERPPFSPCSPFKARDAISRKGKELSVSINNPYSALQDKEKSEMRARVAQRLGGEFMSAVPFATHNRYVKRSGQFLHSPDRNCIGMEQEFLKVRAAQGLLKLKERAKRTKKRWEKAHKIRLAMEARYE